MPAQPVEKKTPNAASQGGAQSTQGGQGQKNTAQGNQAKSDGQAKKEEPKKEEPKKKDPPKKAPVATAPENKAHHATLTETKCNDCAVGLLKQHTSESLRNQRKIDPGNEKHHLQDNEEIEFVRTEPLTLQLVGLRRERSLSNKFDDLMVVLYNPALLKEGEKTVLDAEGLRKDNLASTQSYVNAIQGASDPGAPANWPLPGKDVSCLQCKHWRVMLFPITTEPGYDKDKPSLTDATGAKLPDFDNLTLLPDGVGAIMPGIYNAYYRVGLHLGTRKPPNSFAALQLVPDSVPARRRYPISDYLKSAQAAYDTSTDDDIRKALIKKDAKVQTVARTKIETELAKTMAKATTKEKEAFNKAVQAKLDAENLETYKPKIAEYRKNAAKTALTGLKSQIGSNARIIRLENASGAETQNFETAGNEISGVEVADDDKSPMKVCAQLVYKAAPPAPSTTTPDPKATKPPTPPPPKTLKLTEADTLVTFGAAAGTNMHRSELGEVGSWRRGREVNNWSEGCQVFRSPNDFSNFMRLAMLSKRALCPSRKPSCGEKLKLEDVEKAIGANTTSYVSKCPKEFAPEAKDALTAAFTPPPPPPKPATPDPKAAPAPDPKILAAIEKLVDGSKAYKELDGKMKTAFRQVFTKAYEADDTLKLMKAWLRQKVLAGVNEKSAEADITTAIDAALQDYSKKLTDTKASWVSALQKDLLARKYKEYLADGLEPCDFGTCGFKFDYMLAEVPRANMEAFVSKLGDRSWNALFPDDAPPPAPPPPKQPKQGKPK